MNVIEYVTEEVERQGHDIFALDGIERVEWMLKAWCYALTCRENPTVGTAIKLAQIIEPHKNERGIRMVRVRVGNKSCPEPSVVAEALERLFDNMESLTPVEFYKEFELIHPFVDGNGRTGKILLNWLMGTLLNPVFPPSDLFAHPIQNL